MIPLSLSITVLSIFTLLGQIFLAFFLFSVIYRRFRGKMPFLSIWKFLQRYSFGLAFLIAFSGMIFSLFFSQYYRLEPCSLCWYQRIFLYPQVFLFAVAYFLNDRKIWPYIISLSLIGGLIAAYHSIIQTFQIDSVVCGVDGAVSCITSYFSGLGYINIPIMSLTSFLMILAFAYLASKKEL